MYLWVNYRSLFPKFVPACIQYFQFLCIPGKSNIIPKEKAQNGVNNVYIILFNKTKMNLKIK